MGKTNVYMQSSLRDGTIAKQPTQRDDEPTGHLDLLGDGSLSFPTRSTAPLTQIKWKTISRQ